MRFLSLFSGLGAHDLGLEWAGMECVGQCEIDDYCNQILEKHWPRVPRWKDVTGLTGSDVLRLCGRVDLLTGGFPCQDISVAGKGVGLDGARSGLFFQIVRILQELRDCGQPVPWLLLENVPALRTRGADRVLAELEGLGYACWPLVVGAEHVGAPHRRHRVWIVAEDHSGLRICGRRVSMGDATGSGLSEPRHAGIWQPGAQAGEGLDGGPEQPSVLGQLAHADDARPQGRNGAVLPERPREWPARPGCPQHAWEAPRVVEDAARHGGSRCDGQAGSGRGVRQAGASDRGRAGKEVERQAEPRVGAPTARPAGRVARLKALGNCNPPQIPYVIGKAILRVNYGPLH